ncbi:uncharacterized protein M6B38_239150 [Iris pallida]|uniref:Glycosyltransferase family 92 protein n=1 Tax=Iris pallida TaxID=29817 RepID=A0AAX6DKS5_IRIPA|nr:uncharacterized protein M6B38_239150 [Iris pallida]
MLKMAKEKKEEEKKSSSNNIMVGVIWNCADIKFLMATLLIFFLLATLLIPFKPPFLSYSYSLSSTSCVSSSSNSSSSSLNRFLQNKTVEQQQEQQDSLVLKRSFATVGSAAYLFIQMGAYRGGPTTFAVIGLSSKPLHVYSNPDYACTWVPADNASASVSGQTYKILPDWGYGRVYTVVVVNCTFPSPVSADGSGGRLFVTATAGGGGGDAPAAVGEKFLALEEAPGSVNMSLYSAPPKHDYLYCGSPLYGGLSPQRVREWLAYHVKLFGEERSHFVIHDAGGVHPEVREVLRPWIERGVVTLQDVRDQERFDGYYHNQFLVVNDCLHRYRFTARWIFYFDVDEFIYVEPGLTLGTFMDSMSKYTQFTIEQMPMSSKLCLKEDAGKNGRMWGMEKLVYRDVKRGIRRDRKYVIQPRNAFAAGVHLSQNFDGKTTHKTEGKIKYFHYHGTIANRKEPCREFVNATELTFEGTPYVRDDTLRKLAGSVKMFEAKKIGSVLRRTRQ